MKTANLSWLKIMKRIITYFRLQHVSWRKTFLINFRTLPFKQAKHFPIWVYSNVRLHSIGKIEIHNEIVESGIIRIGTEDFFYNTRFVWNNMGTVIFNGKCMLNGGSQFTNIGGKIEIGKNVRMGENVKIIIKESLSIGEGTRIAFGCLIMDTDFHYLVDIDKRTIKRMVQPIQLGKYNWIGNSSIIRKGTITPNYFIAATTSLLNKNYMDLLPFSLVAGSPAKFIRLYRRMYNMNNENIISQYFKDNQDRQEYKIPTDIDLDNFCLGNQDIIY